MPKIKAQPIQDPGAEVLQQHIGSPHQAREHVTTLPGLEVRRHGFLVPLQERK